MMTRDDLNAFHALDIDSIGLKVRVLQAAFDPDFLHFSDEYYNVLGIERE